MKRKSHIVHLSKFHSSQSYSKLFVDEYNSKYKNSFAVAQPYKEDSVSKIRDTTVNQVIIFHEELEEDVLETQIKEIKTKIRSNLKSILDKAKINVVSEPNADSSL